MPIVEIISTTFKLRVARSFFHSIDTKACKYNYTHTQIVLIQICIQICTKHNVKYCCHIFIIPQNRLKF